MGNRRAGEQAGLWATLKTYANLEMVKRGMAWWYKKYEPKDKDLAKTEEEARGKNRA